MYCKTQRRQKELPLLHKWVKTVQKRSSNSVIFIINSALAITDSSSILTQPQVTSLSSALNCSLCLWRPVFVWQCIYMCVDSRIRVCTCSSPGPQCVYLRVHAHVWRVCAPECVKQTWNWRQRCKNRGNAADQWEHGVCAGHPRPPLHSSPPSGSLRFALPRSLQLVTGALGWMDSYSYSNSSVTLWATGWKRGMVSRPLECTTPFFWTLVESEGR